MMNRLALAAAVPASAQFMMMQSYTPAAAAAGAERRLPLREPPPSVGGGGRLAKENWRPMALTVRTTAAVAAIMALAGCAPTPPIDFNFGHGSVATGPITVTNQGQMLLSIPPGASITGP